ncbi:MAG: hypothetical protein EOO65_02190 [Methanosarcinales archaeon]|nr:MAG: hypothetical protein EOO65_02190 [Methanosarcinales archaeon]
MGATLAVNQSLVSAMSPMALVAILPPVLRLEDIPIDAPANEGIAKLLRGELPADASASAMELATAAFVRGQQGFLFSCTSNLEQYHLQSGVFAAGEEQYQYMRHITAGTPLLLLNAVTRTISGLYLARTPARRDLVRPGTFPNPKSSGGSGGSSSGTSKRYTWQVQVMLVAHVAPLTPDAYSKVVGRPCEGPLSAGDIMQLTIRMLSGIAPTACCELAGRLQQLEAEGMPADGLLGGPDVLSYVPPPLSALPPMMGGVPPGMGGMPPFMGMMAAPGMMMPPHLGMFPPMGMPMPPMPGMMLPPGMPPMLPPGMGAVAPAAKRLNAGSAETKE